MLHGVGFFPESVATIFLLRVGVMMLNDADVMRRMMMTMMIAVHG